CAAAGSPPPAPGRSPLAPGPRVPSSSSPTATGPTPPCGWTPGSPATPGSAPGTAGCARSASTSPPRTARVSRGAGESNCAPPVVAWSGVPSPPDAPPPGEFRANFRSRGERCRESCSRRAVVSGEAGVQAGRVLAVWCQDWPAVAAAAAAGVPAARPVAVLAGGRVSACSATARAQGVRRGARRREAQVCCPDLYLAREDRDRDARLFDPVVAAVEATVPGVEVLRPGLLVLAARGAARFFGSEEAAAERIVDAVAAAGAAGAEAQIGVADE